MMRLVIILLLVFTKVSCFQTGLRRRAAPVSFLRQLQHPTWAREDFCHASTDRLDTKKSEPNLLTRMTRKWKSSRLRNVCCTWRRRMTQFIASLWVVFAVHSHTVWAVTGGRAGGGSFGGSTRSFHAPVGRSGRYALPKSYYHNGRPPITILHRSYGKPSSSTQLFYRSSFNDVAPARAFTKSDMVLLSGMGAVFAYGFFQSNRKGEDDIGASVSTLTIGLDLSADRSVLTRIQNLAQATTVMDRDSVRQLVSDVALELLRQDDSMTAAASSCDFYPRRDLAERAYQRQSILERKKFTRETFQRYGQEQHLEEVENDARSDNLSPPTKAIVTIHVATEGKSASNQALSKSVSSHRELTDTLLALASYGSGEDGLLAAEILWSPQRASDVLSQDDLYAHYPELLPL